MKKFIALSLVALFTVISMGCEKSNNAPFLGTWKRTEYFSDGHEEVIKITFYSDDSFDLISRYYDSNGDYVEDYYVEKSGTYDFSGTIIIFYYNDQDGDDYTEGVPYNYYVVDSEKLYIEIEAGYYHEFAYY